MRIPYCPKVDNYGIHYDRILIPEDENLNISNYLITAI